MAEPMYIGRLPDDGGPLLGEADRLTTHGVVIGMTGFTHDMARVDRIRRELAAAIIALRKALR